MRRRIEWEATGSDLRQATSVFPVSPRAMPPPAFSHIEVGVDQSTVPCPNVRQPLSMPNPPHRRPGRRVAARRCRLTPLRTAPTRTPATSSPTGRALGSTAGQAVGDPAAAPQVSVAGATCHQECHHRCECAKGERSGQAMGQTRERSRRVVMHDSARSRFRRNLEPCALFNIRASTSGRNASLSLPWAPQTGRPWIGASARPKKLVGIHHVPAMFASMPFEW